MAPNGVSTKHDGSKQYSSSSSSSAYLSKFQKLGPKIYFYHPMLQDKNAVGDTTKSDPSEPRPDLIIICSWMAASSRHIAKYTDAYLTRYARIPILLLRSSQIDVLVKPTQDQIEEIQPAITAVQSVFGSLDDKTAPRVLLHVFSNGGSWSATVLATAYQKATFGLSLPVGALVLDSCPSLPHIEQSYLALSTALPKNFVFRFLAEILVGIMLVVVRILNVLHVSENVILRIRRVLNDPAGPFIRGGVPRVYVCSAADKMVPIDDVKRHRDEAVQKMTETTSLTSDEIRYKRVRLEEFQGSPHVGHLMVDADRYWSIVGKVWTEAVNIQAKADADLQKLRDRKPVKPEA